MVLSHEKDVLRATSYFYGAVTLQKHPSNSLQCSRLKGNKAAALEAIRQTTFVYYSSLPKRSENFSFRLLHIPISSCGEVHPTPHASRVTTINRGVLPHQTYDGKLPKK